MSEDGNGDLGTPTVDPWKLIEYLGRSGDCPLCGDDLASHGWFEVERASGEIVGCDSDRIREESNRWISWT